MGALENLLIDMQGMGFLNGMMNKVVLSMVQQNIHNLLMTTGREFMRKESLKSLLRPKSDPGAMELLLHLKRNMKVIVSLLRLERD